jgi:hypothetical protein
LEVVVWGVRIATIRVIAGLIQEDWNDLIETAFEHEQVTKRSDKQEARIEDAGGRKERDLYGIVMAEAAFDH